MLSQQSAARLRTVLAPKAAGTRNLLTAAGAAPLGSVALFSSIAALLGNAGQSNYAAANAVLDACASSSHAQVRIVEASICLLRVIQLVAAGAIPE